MAAAARPAPAAAIGRARWRLSPRAQRRALAAPIVAVLLVLGLYPLVFTLLASASDSSLGRPFRAWTGAAHHAELLASPDVRATLARTAGYAFSVAVLSVLLGLASALALYHAARDRAWTRTLLLLPLIVPPVIVGTLWKLMLNPGGGLLPTVLGLLGVDAAGLAPLASPPWALAAVALADVWEWSPLVALLVFAALLGQDGQVLEAAALDGSRGWAHFRHITLPAIAGTLAAAFFIRLVLAFKVFDLVFITTSGGPGQATTTASYLIYQLALRSFDIGRAAALTLLLALLVTLATLPVAAWTRRLHER